MIGAIFDGNIHSLGGDFYYDPALNRAVSVSTAAITEALNKVYGQTALVAELNRRPIASPWAASAGNLVVVLAATCRGSVGWPILTGPDTDLEEL